MVEEYGSVAEVAALAGVTKQVVSNWRKRHADFPEPVANLKMGPIFELATVRAWLATRTAAQASLGATDTAPAAPTAAQPARLRYEVRVIDTSGCSLEEAAGALETALNLLTDDGLTCAQVVPARQAYSLPDPDSITRDFHYVDVGFLIIGERT